MEMPQVRGGPSKIKAVLESAGYSWEEASPSPLYLRYFTPPTNYVGTAAFLAYISAALYLTYLIVVRDILPRWNSVRVELRRRRDIVAAFAGLSFAVGSWNLLQFLGVRYTQYLERSGRGTFELGGLWEWMLDSAFFTDFTRELLADPMVVVWTRAGLLGTMIIALETAAISRRHGVDMKWSYALLSQIMPATLVWYLIQLRATVSEASRKQIEKPGSYLRPTQPWRLSSNGAKILLVSIAAMVLDILSLNSDAAEYPATTVLWLFVAQTRLLLLLPFFQPAVEAYIYDEENAFKRPVLMIAPLQLLYHLLPIMLQAVKSQDPALVKMFFQAGWANPAVAVLSWDWVVAAVGGGWMRKMGLREVPA